MINVGGSPKLVAQFESLLYITNFTRIGCEHKSVYTYICPCRLSSYGKWKLFFFPSPFIPLFLFLYPWDRTPSSSSFSYSFSSPPTPGKPVFFQFRFSIFHLLPHAHTHFLSTSIKHSKDCNTVKL